MKMESTQLMANLIPSAGRLLAEAFYTNPAHVYLCPNEHLRYRQLEWLLTQNLRVQPLSRSFCIVDGVTVSAMGFWTRAIDQGSSLGSLVRAGLFMLPIRLGVKGGWRVLEVTSNVEQQRDESVLGKSWWYLNNMAVRAELRGSGLGTQLLKDQISRIAADDPEATLVLSTQRPENVRFYSGLGFVIAKSKTIGRGSLAFQNWTMIRPV